MKRFTGRLEALERQAADCSIALVIVDEDGRRVAVRPAAGPFDWDTLVVDLADAMEYDDEQNLY